MAAYASEVSIHCHAEALEEGHGAAGIRVRPRTASPRLGRTRDSDRTGKSGRGTTATTRAGAVGLMVHRREGTEDHLGQATSPGLDSTSPSPSPSGAQSTCSSKALSAPSHF